MDFYSAHISRKAIELAVKTLRSTQVSEGRQVVKFEEELTRRIGLDNAVAVNSGTAALHLALAVSGIGEGDEVILPAQTFVATGMVILMQRAKPVFADIDWRTGNISVDSIQKKITKRTRAIMVVHWGGYACDLEEINQLAKKHQLAVIEDAAQALGATYKGKPIGAISRFCAFSFQAIKHLTTGDGGALCCLNKNDYLHARSLRWFGISREKSKPSILGERVYDLPEIGFKYHMNDLAASVGLGNLADFKKNLAIRRKIAKYYRNGLKNVPGLTLLDYKDDRESAYWLFTVLVERREDFIRKLKEKGIPTSVVHLRIDRNSVFGGKTAGLVGQERFDEQQISIPIHSKLSSSQIELIISTIKRGW